MAPKSPSSRLCEELTVGELARRSGLAVSAIHFYESKGLIESWRSGGNQRRYPREILRRVAVIKIAQRLGVPVNDPRYVTAATGGPNTYQARLEPAFGRVATKFK